MIEILTDTGSYKNYIHPKTATNQKKKIKNLFM